MSIFGSSKQKRQTTIVSQSINLGFLLDITNMNREEFMQQQGELVNLLNGDGKGFSIEDIRKAYRLVDDKRQIFLLGLSVAEIQKTV